MPTEVTEALVSTQVSPLIPKLISPVLLEYQRRYAPMVRVLPTTPWESNQYFFNIRTVRPAAGFVTDGGARPIANSTYAQQSFNVRLLQGIGAVTGFAQAVTAKLVDLRQKEFTGLIQGLLWDMETALLYGSDPATVAGPFPQFTGFDQLVANFSAGTGINQFVNALDLAHASIALRNLDQLIDMVETNAAMPVGSNYVFLCSASFQSKIAQLLTNQQRFLDKVEVAPGLITPSYRDVPFIKSSFLAPRSNTMGAVTTSTATTGGTLAAGSYFYRVAPVIQRYGELAASSEVSQATTGTTSTVTLTLPATTGPEGLAPQLWKVFRSTATGTESLLGVVDAFDTTVPAANANGNPVTTIIDTGTNLLTNSAAATGPAAYVGTNAGHYPHNTNDEDIYLVPNDEDFLVRPYVRDMIPIDLPPPVSAPDTLPFAVVTDTCLAIRAPKYVGRLRNGQVSL